MSCNICDFHKNPNNPRWPVTHACVDALSDRVAKLEAAVERLCDNVLLIDRVDTLEAKLAQAHDDAQRAILAATESLTKDAADLRTKLAQTERERDEWKRKATAVPMRELPSDIP